MKHSWEYFSLHYLNMWLRHDRLCHESMNNGNRSEKLISIKKAAAYYKVSRNLPKEYDEDAGFERYEPIVKILDGIKASSFSDNPVKSIKKVESKISTAYGGRGVLSITTKLLWLKVRDPILIYDSQARKALNTVEGKLSEFYSAWENEYSKHSKAIDAACAKLNEVAKYSCDQTIANSVYVKNISAELWFKKRVFDMYLWHKGL